MIKNTLHIATKVELIFPPQRKIKGSAIRNKIWQEHQKQSEYQTLPTTSKGGFFMPKNKMQLTD